MDYLGELITLGIDSIIFGICLRQYFHCKHAISAIENVEVREVGADLANLFDNNSDKAKYVAVRGIVKPIGKPLTGINGKYISAVIQKLKIKEHVVVRTTTGFWSDQKRAIYKIYNTVPFGLQRGSYSVEILEPLSADILDLEVVSDTFEPSTPTFIDHLWGFFTGIRQRGLQSTEELLREGAVMTGIGELSKSTTNPKQFQLQPPQDGTPFYLTSMSINSLIRKLDDRKKTYQMLCLMFGMIGIAIGGIILRHYWKERKIQKFAATRKERRQRLREKNLRDDQQCIVCSTNPREVILLPCGHVCLCEDCSDDITNDCPICRTPINQKAAAYIV